MGDVRITTTTVAARRAWQRETLLVATGCIALSTGLAVYLADRHGTQAGLAPVLAGVVAGPIFGPLGEWLPSGVHTFAFSLFTAAVLRPGAAPRRVACAAWCAVNLAFEIGQHAAFKPHWAAAQHTVAGASPIARPVLRYLMAGTFDAGDVAAILLGALAASLLLQFVNHKATTRHASQ